MLPASASHLSPSAQMAAEILASSAVASNSQQGTMPFTSHLNTKQPVGMQQQQQQAQQQPPSLYMLQWHEHHSSFFQLMEELCQSQAMTDVTVACGDVSLEAHSLILSASSPILRSILAKGGAGVPGHKQTLHFMDMNPVHMQLLLQYMYRGEVSVHQSQLGPLMQSAKALQIKGLCSSSAEEKFVAPSVNAPTINVPTMPSIPQTLVTPTQHQLDDFSGKKKRKLNDWDDVEQEIHASGLRASSRRRSKSNRKFNSSSPVAPCQQGSPTSSTHGVAEHSQLLLPKMEFDAASSSSLRGANSEIGVVVDDDLSASTLNSVVVGGHHQQMDNTIPSNDETPNGNSASMENWSEQPTMKVKGHRIPILPKPLSQMKTTETRSYLSRLIWATNDWKRPQYGNPDTKPVWWPNDLLSWSEMKKMGGKKSAGLTNVNYNEIQKNILHEGYKYFGFDPETLWNMTKENGGEMTRTQEKLSHILDSAISNKNGTGTHPSPSTAAVSAAVANLMPPVTATAVSGNSASQASSVPAGTSKM